MAISLEQIFTTFSSDKLLQLSERICACLDILDTELIWQRASENENAIGNLVLHLCGNLRQWIGFGVAGKPDIRERALEFAARGGIDVAELKKQLRGAVEEAVSEIRVLKPERLGQPTKIQSYELSVSEAVYHVVEHFAGHTGQIIFATKHLTGQDLAFYKHLERLKSHQERVP
jgi:uncharacterized damage-inducible protein DinB